MLQTKLRHTFSLIHRHSDTYRSEGAYRGGGGGGGGGGTQRGTREQQIHQLSQQLRELESKYNVRYHINHVVVRLFNVHF